MRLPDFEAMILRMADEIPPEFLEGVADIRVSPRTVVHPEREGIWTLGECIPLPSEGADPHQLQSRVVLYHGSFQALAREDSGFDWRAEAWETLTHEVRHHVEWRARAPGLDAYDRAAEANFARHDGEPFDVTFYRDGTPLAEAVWQVDDDVFIERPFEAAPAELRIRWQGADHVVPVPEGATAPAFLTVANLHDPPPGDLVVVLQSPGRLADLFRRRPAVHFPVEARPLPG